MDAALAPAGPGLKLEPEAATEPEAGLAQAAAHFPWSAAVDAAYPAVVSAKADVDDVENSMSDKVITLLRRVTDGEAAPPPQDALAQLSAGAAKMEDARVMAIIEWCRRRLFHGSPVVVHKTLTVLKLLSDNVPAVKEQLKRNPAACDDILKTMSFDAAEDPDLGTKPVQLVRDAAETLLVTLTGSSPRQGEEQPQPAEKARRQKRTKTRRQSIVGGLAAVKTALTHGGQDTAASSDPRLSVSRTGTLKSTVPPGEGTVVDLDALLACDAEQLADKFSDKILTLLRRSTQDDMAPPPPDAIQDLTESSVKQPAEVRMAIVEWLRRKLFDDSTVVRHKALVTLRLLLENATRAMLPTLRLHEVALLDVEAMKTFEAVAAVVDCPTDEGSGKMLTPRGRGDDGQAASREEAGYLKLATLMVREEASTVLTVVASDKARFGVELMAMAEKGREAGSAISAQIAHGSVAAAATATATARSAASNANSVLETAREHASSLGAGVGGEQHSAGMSSEQLTQALVALKRRMEAGEITEQQWQQEKRQLVARFKGQGSSLSLSIAKLGRKMDLFTSFADFSSRAEQNLLDVKSRLATSYAERSLGEFGGLSKQTLRELQECTAATGPSPELLPEMTLHFMQLARNQGTTAEGAGSDVLNWLLMRLNDTSDIVKSRALGLIQAILSTASLPMETLAHVSLPLFEELAGYKDLEDPAAPDGPQKQAVAQIGLVAGDICEMLAEAQQRVLEGRAARRAEAEAARELLRVQARVEGEAAGVEETTMLYLLECAADDERPPPLESVMGLTQALQTSAVHRQIHSDMVDFVIKQSTMGATGDSEGSEGSMAVTLSNWAKTSDWAATTGGDKDENGAPIRAQIGVWKDMWEAIVAAKVAAEAASKPIGDQAKLDPEPEPEPEPEAELGSAAVHALHETLTASADTVPLIAAPKTVMAWLLACLLSASVSVKLKILHITKDLYAETADAQFGDALKAQGTGPLGKLLDFRVPAARGAHQMAQAEAVREVARELLEELHPRLREQRMEEEARKAEEAAEAALLRATSRGTPRDSVRGAKAAIGRKSRRLSVVARTLQHDLSVLASESSGESTGSEAEGKEKKSHMPPRSKIEAVDEIPERTRHMAHMIFVELDQDKDRLLNLKELQDLATRTGGELKLEEYRMVCEAVTADVTKGMDEAGLLRIYTDLGLGSIEDDFAAMGLALPAAEEGVPPESAELVAATTQ